MQYSHCFFPFELSWVKPDSRISYVYMCAYIYAKILTHNGNFITFLNFRVNKTTILQEKFVKMAENNVAV